MLNPQEISNKIKYNADITYSMGELILDSKIKYKYNIWSITTGEKHIIDLEKATKILLNRIYPVKGMIKDLFEKGVIETELQYVLFISEKGTPSFHIGNELQKIISDLNAEIDVDLYVE
jgi:hypothetical protein